jgi:hypothetical protein
MLDIPEQLKWYMPLNLGTGSGLSAWRLSVDDVTGCIEIKRSPLIQLSVVLGGLFIGTFLLVCLIGMYISDEPVDKEKPFAIAVMILCPLLSVCAFVALDIFCTMADCKYWTEPIRFRYDSHNGELLFPRENITYGVGDYKKIILGCVSGYDLQINVPWYNKRRRYFRAHTQIFVLILDQNDEWKRYNLSNDRVSWQNNKSGSRQFIKLADLLGQHLQFEQFVKGYSTDKCYVQQQGNDGV